MLVQFRTIVNNSGEFFAQNGVECGEMCIGDIHVKKYGSFGLAYLSTNPQNCPVIPKVNQKEHYFEEFKLEKNYLLTK